MGKVGNLELKESRKVRRKQVPHARRRSEQEGPGSTEAVTCASPLCGECFFFRPFGARSVLTTYPGLAPLALYSDAASRLGNNHCRAVN